MKGNVESLTTEQIAEVREISSAHLLPAVKVGRIVALSAMQEPLIDFPENLTGELVAARTLVRLSAVHIGKDVALAFEDGDAARPIILGVLRDAAEPVADVITHPALDSESTSDQESIVLTAARDISLVCGKASITLTNAGKILLRGAYLLSRSSGVNRIKGGSVQIN